MHAAIELRSELVQRARTKLAALDCAHIDVRHGNCLEIDASSSMRFQRIYVGAGADEAMAAILFGMLELGGVLVGPFAGADGSQRLLSVRRLGDSSFQVRELMHVQFTPMLSHPPPEERAALAALAAARHSHAVVASESPTSAPSATIPSPSNVSGDARGAQALSKLARSSNPITLEAPFWSPDTHGRFPEAHEAAVYAVLLVHARAASELSVLPKEVLLQELLPKISYGAFAPASLPDDLVLATVAERINATSDGGDPMSEEEEEEEEDYDDDEDDDEDEDEDEDEEAEDIGDASADESDSNEMEEASSSAAATAIGAMPEPQAVVPPMHPHLVGCGRLLQCL